MKSLFAVLAFVALTASAQTTLPWHRVGALKGVGSNSYTPVVPQRGSDQIVVFRNSAGSGSSDLLRASGTWSRGVGKWSKVLHITDPRDDWIRTSGCAQGESGTMYCVLYIGDNYPTQGGYSPSWATSTGGGYIWQWHGPISPFGRNQSSAMNLIVDESRVDDYRFMFWMDYLGLQLVHSADGVTWRSDGVNMWPRPNESPQFVGGVKTPMAYHLIGMASWPGPTVHIVSCDGINDWEVVEDASVLNTGKGANLSYDATTNTIHALVSGVHWTLQETYWGCP